LYTLVVKDNRHSIKLVSDFITAMKHLITDRDFPIRHLNKFFTVAGEIQNAEWEQAKKNPETKKAFIDKLKKFEKKLEDDDMVYKKKENEDEE